MRGKKAVHDWPEPSWQEWVLTNQAAGAQNGGYSSIQEAISTRAYGYWEARGFQGGSAEQDWLRAEAEIQRERSGANGHAEVAARMA